MNAPKGPRVCGSGVRPRAGTQFHVPPARKRSVSKTPQQNRISTCSIESSSIILLLWRVVIHHSICPIAKLTKMVARNTPGPVEASCNGALVALMLLACLLQHSVSSFQSIHRLHVGQDALRCSRTRNQLRHQFLVSHLHDTNRILAQFSHCSTTTPPRHVLQPVKMSTNGASYDPSADPREKKPRKQGLRFPFPKNNPFRQLLAQLEQLRLVFLTRFKSLPRKLKIVVMMQLLAVSLLLGSAVKRTVELNYSESSASTTTATRLTSRRNKPVEVYYSSFLDLVEKSGKGYKPGENPSIVLEDVQIGQDRISFQVKQDEEQHKLALLQKSLVEKNDLAVKEVQPRNAYAMKISASQDLVNVLRQNNIPFRAMSNKTTQTVGTAIKSFLFMMYFLMMLRLYRAMSLGGGSGDTPGKLAQLNSDMPMISFDDIQGMDAQKFEVMELVDTLRNPMKYELIGARPPCGLLMVGPPGTGKTMLARAVATCAGVPLLYCSGSDFVEMYVGRGAARVRKTFARAAKLAPCIIFIDEIDALGKSRSANGFRIQSNDEAEQTLNQLLSCMDGLSSSKGVIVLAATNRREVLDPALVRPGRFDRIIEVELPDAEGRERILRVHASKLKGFTEARGVDDSRLGSMGKGYTVDLSAVAAVTSGLSGAELEFIVNEAAIRAVRRVSAELGSGKDMSQIIPRISATDFESSVKSFYKTRKPGRKGLIENVLGAMS